MKSLLKTALINTVFIILMLQGNYFAQSITKENIESAKKIIGLEFSDAERDSMLNNLE